MNAVLYCVRPWLSPVFVRCVFVQSDAPDPFVNLSFSFVQKASECCCPGAGQAESALNPHRFLTLCLSLCPFHFVFLLFVSCIQLASCAFLAPSSSPPVCLCLQLLLPRGGRVVLFLPIVRVCPCNSLSVTSVLVTASRARLSRWGRAGMDAASSR